MENNNNNSNKDLNSWTNKSNYKENQDFNDANQVKKELLNIEPSHYFMNNKKKNSKKTNSFFGKKNNKGLKAFLITSSAIACMSAMTFGAASVASYLTNKHVNINSLNPFCKTKTLSNLNSQVQLVDLPPDTKALTAKEIYKKVSPAIVSVVTSDPSAGGLMGAAMGEGTGAIFNNKDGYSYIVTNSHVIGNSSKNNVTVITPDGKEYAAETVGYDKRTDIAVLKIKATDLPTIEFGNSDALEIGEKVYAIGNPGGQEFSNSMTDGMISGLNRSLGSSDTNVKFIQTNADINPGNSGGPLLNEKGQVIGVNSRKIASAEFQGMGFSIPSKDVVKVVNDIIANGYVSGRAKLGISVCQLSANEAQMYDVPRGLVIKKIDNDSNAMASGLRVGDLITKINDINTPGTNELFNELEKHKPGEDVKLSICRVSARRNSPPTYFDANVKLIEDKGPINDESKEHNEQPEQNKERKRSPFGNGFGNNFGFNFGNGWPFSFFN